MEIINKNIFEYIEKHNNIVFSEILNNEKECKELVIPIVDNDVGQFLYSLVRIHSPKKILEIGFGGGQSTLWLAKGLNENSQILSLDTNKQRVERGKILFKKLSFSENVEILYKDAHRHIAECIEMKEKFDFIFLDAIKRSYIKYLPNIPLILKEKGLFVVDNVFFRGMVVQKKIEKKYQDGVFLLNEFNDKLSKSKVFDVNYLAIGDGVALCVKNTQDD